MGVDGISLPFVILTTALMPFYRLKLKSIAASSLMAFLLLKAAMVVLARR